MSGASHEWEDQNHAGSLSEMTKSDIRKMVLSAVDLVALAIVTGVRLKHLMRLHETNMFVTDYMHYCT
jgi:hypothetical protein